MRRATLAGRTCRLAPPRWRSRGTLAAAVVLAAAAPLLAQDLTGSWCDDNGTRYVVRQAGSDLCWRMDGLPRVQNVFCGSVIGNLVVGSWLDLPGGQLLGGGRLILSIDSPGRMSKAYQDGSYGGSVWTRSDSGNCSEARPSGGSYPAPAAGTSTGPQASAPPPPPRPSSTFPTTPRTAAPPTPTLGGPVSLPPRSGSWRLVSLEQRGSMDDRLPTPGDGGMRFEVRRFDSTGGEFVATVTMASPAICPQAASESVLVRWRFPYDIRYLAPGDEFAVDVSVEPYSQAPACSGGVFGRSEAVVMRSEGSIEDIEPSERPGYWPVFTHPYVKDPTGVRLNFYVGGAPTGRAVLHVNDERPPINGPGRSSFSIRFYSNACCGTPSSANSWAFHYFYEY